MCFHDGGVFAARILNSLGHFGFNAYKKPFLDMLKDAMDKGYLTSCRQSYNRFWCKTICVSEKLGDWECVEDLIPSVFFKHIEDPVCTDDLEDSSDDESDSTIPDETLPGAEEAEEPAQDEMMASIGEDNVTED